MTGAGSANTSLIRPSPPGEMERCLAHQVGQRRAVRTKPQPRADLRLAVQREVIAVLRDQHMREKALGRKAAHNQRAGAPPAPRRRPCTGCRRSAGEPSRSPRTAPARCRGARCDPCRSSPSRRSLGGTECWRARSPPRGARCGPGSGPQGTPGAAAGAVPPPCRVRPRPGRRRLPTPPSRDRRTTARGRPCPASPNFLPNRSLRNFSSRSSWRRFCSAVSAFSASRRAASASALLRADRSPSRRHPSAANGSETTAGDAVPSETGRWGWRSA